MVVIRGRERYVPCTNAAAGTDHFVLPAEEYAAAEDQGEIVAVVHSHPDVPADPSQADLVACEASGLPWYIVRVDLVDGAALAGQLVSIEPTGYQAPLVGRQFAHGVLDCYQLIVDWYARECGVTLKQFARQITGGTTDRATCTPMASLRPASSSWPTVCQWKRATSS